MVNSLIVSSGQKSCVLTEEELACDLFETVPTSVTSADDPGFVIDDSAVSPVAFGSVAPGFREEDATSKMETPVVGLLSAML